MRLSKTQQEVLNILKEPGSFLHFMEYMGRFNPNAYYFPHNHIGMHIRFSTVCSLLKKKLVVRKKINEWGKHRIFINPELLTDTQTGPDRAGKP